MTEDGALLSEYSTLESGDAIKADREIVLAAVAENGHAIRYAATDLRADKEVNEINVWHCWP